MIVLTAYNRDMNTTEGTTMGYRVSATVLGRVNSVVFSTMAAAETFVAANAHRECVVDIVALDANGKIIKQCSCGNATDPHRGTCDACMLDRLY